MVDVMGSERKLAAQGTFLGLWRLKVEPKRREFHICHAYAFAPA